MALCLIGSLNSSSQEKPKVAAKEQNGKVTIYDPSANAELQISEAVKKADLEKKHVLIKVGGNWCIWCVRLHSFFQTDKMLDSLLKADYVLVNVNYSPENKNFKVLNQLDYPQRFGFPVLVILDGKGKRLHTQDSGLLEMPKGSATYYDHNKVAGFLRNWKYAALEAENYPEK
jgi:thiol:disulfide interchange protein